MNCEICGAKLNVTESQNETLCVACYKSYFEQHNYGRPTNDEGNQLLDETDSKVMPTARKRNYEYDNRIKNSAITIILLTSLAFFVVSLALPAFDTNVTYMIESRMHEPNKRYFGYEVLLLGWASIFFGTFAWFANVGYLVSLVLILGKNKLSLLISTLTLMIALSSLTYPTIERGENGYDFYISSFNSGFYFWLAAIGFSCAAALIQQNRRSLADSRHK